MRMQLPMTITSPVPKYTSHNKRRDILCDRSARSFFFISLLEAQQRYFTLIVGDRKLHIIISAIDQTSPTA